MIIQVNKRPASVKTLSDGRQVVGGWTIDAGLDENEPASLLIRKRGGEILLAVDCPKIETDDRSYRGSNATLLIERGRVIRSKDRLPAAAQHLESR
jgi:hypothetical protein